MSCSAQSARIWPQRAYGGRLASGSRGRSRGSVYACGLRVVILGIRFVLELCLFAALAAGGWDLAAGGLLGAGLATAAAVAGAVVWGAWIAPRSKRRLRDPQRFGLEVALFALGGLALWAIWSPTAGVVFAVASGAVAALTRVVGEPALQMP
jgi:hypothetical protein